MSGSSMGGCTDVASGCSGGVVSAGQAGRGSACLKRDMLTNGINKFILIERYEPGPPPMTIATAHIAKSIWPLRPDSFCARAVAMYLVSNMQPEGRQITG